MNLSLDIRILILLLGIGYFFTLILIIAYNHSYKTGIEANTFFKAKLIQTIGWFCLVFRGGELEFLSTIVANSLLFISYVLEIIALISLNQKLSKKAKMSFFIYTLLSIIGYQLILTFYNNENIRIAYFSLVKILIYVQAYRLVFNKTVTILTKSVGIIYLISVIFTLIRGIISITSSTFSTSLFTPGHYQMIAFLFLYIFTSLGSIGFILLLKEKADKELIYYASYDDLTNVLNRRTFTEKAEKYLLSHAKSRQPLSFVLFDIDDFKNINDSFGHHVGDKVLQNLTTQIKSQLDQDDLFGRYGGDEFGILMAGKDVEESDKIAERIINSLNNTIYFTLPVNYTISMGIITIIPKRATKLEVLYTTCDKALYKAKRNGRNSVFRGYLEQV